MFGRQSKIERAYHRYPSAPLFARFAETRLSQGDVERALAVCLEGCERFPEYPTGYYLLGRCYQAQGDLEEARAALDTSLRLDAENPRGFELLAQVYADLEIPTLALKCMEEAARLDPFDETISLQVEQLSPQEPAVPATAEPTETASGDEVSSASFETADAIDAAAEEEKAPEYEEVEPDIDGNIATEAEIEADGSETPDSEVAEPLVEPEAEPELTTEPEDEHESTQPASSNEPFGELRDLPEWDTEEPQPQSAEPPLADSAPALGDPALAEPAMADPAEPEPDASDEVAALGAELFGEELPAAPEKPPEPPIPVPAVTPPTGGADLVSSDTTEDIGTGSQEVVTDKPDGVEAVDLERLIPGMVEPGPEPEPEPEPEPVPEVTSNTAAEATDGDDPAVSRFSRDGDSEMADLLREIDGDGEDERAEADLPGPIPTTTLAELYSVQGFVERAIETYRQVLMAQPDNEEAKTRLTALERRD